MAKNLSAMYNQIVNAIIRPPRYNLLRFY